MHESAPRSQPRLRVFVVDADDRVRESLTGLLAIGDHVDVVGAAGDTKAALELISTLRPDVVVLDPRLPEVERGVAFIDTVRAVAPGIRVLVLHYSEVVEECLDECHPDGIVRKTYRPSELLAAVQAACTPAPPT